MGLQDIEETGYIGLFAVCFVHEIAGACFVCLRDQGFCLVIFSAADFLRMWYGAVGERKKEFENAY